MPGLDPGIHLKRKVCYERGTMTKRAFDKIKAGLDDAHAFLEGSADTKRYRVHITISSAKEGPRSTMGKPGQRGGWKKRRR